MFERDWLYRLLILVSGTCLGFAQAAAQLPQRTQRALLEPESYHLYFDSFAEQEKALLGVAPAVPWVWFRDNVPWIDIPDQNLEESYYFRWYAFQKHIRPTPYGRIVDEFLPDVPWAGPDNSIPDAAEHHIREARWLRDGSLAKEYAKFWFSPDGQPRRYSFAAAHAVYELYLANGDEAFAVSLLPDLVKNDQAWESTHQDANGLYWQIDDRDGMEDSIGGSGYRPTINSYMYGDDLAIANIAVLAGDRVLEKNYRAKAAELQDAINTKLWNPTDHFYETVPRKPGASWVNVRELIGYVPWYYNIPGVDQSVAWKQLGDSEGFYGKFGPTTAERRNPRFRFPDPHECLWNGPTWPFATTQTLVAMANLLHGPPQPYVHAGDYLELLERYAKAQHLRTPDGKTIPWIDEDQDPDTGDWLARDILIQNRQPPFNRGRYYNHSGFADLILTGLLGILPSQGNTLTIAPLLPRTAWSYFAVQDLPYHHHLLTIWYDATGHRYHRGRGLHVWIDGKEAAASPVLAKMTVPIP